MENITDILLQLADKAGPVGASIIAIGLIILYYFKKTNKSVVKTTVETTEAVKSVDSNIKVLSNTVLDMNNTNKDLIISLSNNSNNLSEKIITAIINNNKIIEKEKQSRHDEDYESRLYFSAEIKENLYEILCKCEADLVVLTELHNGGNNLSGLPFTAYNITEQTTSTNSNILTCALENRPMSEYCFIYREILKSNKNIFWGNVDKISVDIDGQISAKLKLINKASMICIGLFNNNNKIFAFINIFFNDKYLTQEFIDQLNIYKQQITITNKIDSKKHIVW